MIIVWTVSLIYGTQAGWHRLQIHPAFINQLPFSPNPSYTKNDRGCCVGAAPNAKRIYNVHDCRNNVRSQQDIIFYICLTEIGGNFINFHRISEIEPANCIYDSQRIRL